MGLLKEMGTDLVSLANNHIYDYGEEAMLDTIKYLEADDPATVTLATSFDRPSRI